jgi:hypothetical protein
MQRILLFSSLCIFCAGCGGTGASPAYQTSYAAAYEDAYKEGVAIGRTEGTNSATRSANDGNEWIFYREAAYFALTLGVVIGVAAQYFVLVLTDPERCVTVAATLLVPAVRHSVVFKHFKRTRELRMAAEEQLEKVRHAERVRLAEIHASREVAIENLLTDSILDELRVKQISNAATDEMARMVASPKPELPPLSCKCPSCGRSIGYGRKKAGKEAWCPHCGKPLMLPTDVGGNVSCG